MSATNAVASGRLLRATFCKLSGEAVRAEVVATGKASAAFRRWVDDLPEDTYPTLVRLRQDGFAEDLAALEAQLLRALREEPVGPLTQIVGQRVRDLLGSHLNAACIFLEEE